MAVAAAGDITRVQLTQVSELDPRWMLIFSADLAGDGSGGLNQVTNTLPTDLGCMWVSMSAEMNASSTSNVHYAIVSGLATHMRRGALAVNVGVTNAPNLFDPPSVLLFEHPILALVSSDNTNLETMSTRVVAFAWELQIARNLPQRFFWPGKLGG